ncbi:Transcription termination factor 1 [Trichinella zimbabwensis]|uniref:Transcription termination factor 1 n=1 Tax=Trichinella zimbabwensis TaxID=268475 RepID=A0A0V1I382_9BILA|nr:Transcription termination factor 1 [Trichinella zimbabwensis]
MWYRLAEYIQNRYLAISTIISKVSLFPKSKWKIFFGINKAKQKLAQQLHSLNKQLLRRLNRNCIAALHPDEEVLHGHDTKDSVSFIDVRLMSTENNRKRSSKRHKSKFEPLTEDKIPFWHRRNSRFSKHELELLKEMNITLKSGPFSEKEDKRIRKNWRRYSRFYNVDYRDFFYSENSQIPNRRFFLKSTHFYAELARKLPWRSSFSVMQRARSILHPNYKNRKNYTEEQTEAIGNFVKDIGRKWGKIGDELGRTPCSVCYRYRVLRHRKGRFSPEEHTAMFEAIKTYLEKSTESELLNVRVNEIAWPEIRKQVPERSLYQLKSHWCTWILQKINIRKYQKKIFNLRYCVQKIGISKYSDVDWEFVGEYLGTDPYLARRVYYSAVNKFCRGVKELSVLCKHVTQCNAHSFQSHDHYNGHMLEEGFTFFGF